MNVMGSIPQLFYDLIAKVIPGIVLLVLLKLIVSYPIDISKSQELINKNLNFVNVIVILIFAYVISVYMLQMKRFFDFILSKIPFIKRLYTTDIFRNNITLLNNITNTYKNIDILVGADNLKCISIPFMFDYIRIANPEIGFRISKLRAEYRLGLVIFYGGIVLIFFYNLYQHKLNFFDMIPLNLLLICISVMSGFYMKNQKDKYINSVTNNWILIKSHLDSKINFNI